MGNIIVIYLERITQIVLAIECDRLPFSQLCLLLLLIKHDRYAADLCLHKQYRSNVLDKSNVDVSILWEIM